MSDKTRIELYDGRGSRFASWLRLIFTLVFLAFCIWLSKGSTWWTFVTGVLFLLVVIASTLRGNEKFNSLYELQLWVERERRVERARLGLRGETDGKTSDSQA